MTGKIIDFKKESIDRGDIIWKCNCGNASFILYENGGVECAECNNFQTGIEQDITIRHWTRKVDKE